MTRLIGLTGYARSGKDTVGGFLVRNHGFTRVSFADKLKDLAYRANPNVLWHGTAWPLSKVVDGDGWEQAKTHPEVRRFLQQLGVAVRDVLGEDTWVDAAIGDLTADRVVVTDVRFRNEHDRIVDLGGTVYRVVRPGVEAVNGHVSETDLDDLDLPVIPNVGTLDDLECACQAMIALEKRYTYWKARSAAQHEHAVRGESGGPTWTSDGTSGSGSHPTW